MSKGKITIIGALALVPVLVLTTSKLLASSGDNDDTLVNLMPQNYIIEPKISGDVKITREDSATFQRYAEKAQSEDWSGLPTSEIIKKTGEFFRGTPYVAFTLEGNESEEHLDEYIDSSTERGKCLVQKICEEMGFDSLSYQSLDGMLEAIGIDRNKICTYCWNGRE